MSSTNLKHALKQWRDTPLATMTWHVPLHRLLDVEYCELVTQMVTEHSERWEAMKATPTLWKQLPEHSGIYMFVWRPALRFCMEAGRYNSLTMPVYVGKAGGRKSTNTLKKRYKAEYSNYLSEDPRRLWSTHSPQNRQERLQRYLQLRPLEYWFVVAPTPEYADELESHLLNTLSPPGNKMSGVMARLENPKPAF